MALLKKITTRHSVGMSHSEFTQTESANVKAKLLHIDSRHLNLLLQIAGMTCALIILFFATPAHACTNPAGNEGDTIYNGDYIAMQYCDGTNWIAMGRTPGTAACTTGLSEVGSLSNANLDGALRVAVAGNYAYVASFAADSLTIIDISTPATPTQVGTISNANLDVAADVAVAGNYAYVASQVSDSLTIIDVSTPATPTQVGTISNANLNGAFGVAVAGNYAYVASSFADSLTVIDISTPATPTQVGTISNANLNGARAVKVIGNYAYVASLDADRLTIIDISTPASPTQAGTISNANLDGASGVAVAGNYAYVASLFADSLTIIDISTPATPTEVGTISNANLDGINGVAVAGNYAYVASINANSLTTIDISNPASPTQVNTISNSNLDAASGVAIAGNYAYVASRDTDALTIIEETCTVQDGLVGYWRLDETSGTTATDSSFNNNNGTIFNGGTPTIRVVTAPIETALYIDGVDDYIDIGSLSLAPTNTVTMTAWINTPNPTQDLSGILFDRLNAASASGLGLRSTSGELGYHWASDLAAFTFASGLSIPADEWVLVAVAIDPSEANLYLGSGGSISSATRTASHVNYTFDNLRIGEDTFGTRHFEGAIDDVRFYDRTLSAAEITTLYDAGRDRGLVGHWKLDETAGTTAADSTINGNDGTADFNFTGNSVVGKIDNAIDFGLSSNNTITANVVPVGSNLPFTVSVWHQYPTINGSNIGRLFSLGNTPAAPDMTIFLRSGPQFLWVTEGATRFLSLPDEGKWYNHTATYDGTTARLYRNGILLDSFAVSINTADTEFHIGDYNPNDAHRQASGYIDDVRFYNRALSADEVFALYTERFNICANPDGHEGDIRYDGDQDVMVYCNADGWQAMGPEGDGGAGCTNPTGARGDIIYNDVGNVMQYCEGDDWVAIGK